MIDLKSVDPDDLPFDEHGSWGLGNSHSTYFTVNNGWALNLGNGHRCGKVYDAYVYERSWQHPCDPKFRKSLQVLKDPRNKIVRHCVRLRLAM